MRLVLALALAAAVAVAAGSAHGSAPGIPRGFDPESAAVVGAGSLWVLGDYGCGGNYCHALVRSTDAGKHFTRVGVPLLPARGTVPTVVFANRHDGFAYVEGVTPLYVTRDGGESWHRSGPNREVSAFATAGGYAYLLVGRHRFERSRVDRDAWRNVRLPVPHQPFSLAARGSDVWFLGPPRHRPDFDTIALSSDHGRSFTFRQGPCLSELGGTLVPAANRVVWAVCPTGNFSQTHRSTNDGGSFRVIQTPGQTNGAEVVPFSSRAAVLDAGAQGRLYRTTDRGAHWMPVPSTPRDGQFLWLASATKRLGFAVIETGAGRQRLWRTTDGGASWHSVPIR